MDVRPSPSAAFDGDRIEMPLHVIDERERFPVDRNELPQLETTVLSSLQRGEKSTVRFGDRAFCRQLLERPAVEAIERHLLSATRRGRSTLVTWTGDGPERDDYRTYDVVVDGPAFDFD